MNEFEIGRILGKGSFGMVCLVKRKIDGKIYAMKKVKIQQLNEKAKQNTLNEIRILASLSHKNIIGYKDAFFDENSKTLNIVMEFADDGDILTKIKHNIKNNLLYKECVIWFFLVQILEGLSYLHENKIIHRDLKNANIFLTKDGTVKIGDLNVSKITKKNEMATTQTGTPYYVAPEIWRNKPYEYKCDIWSLGCIVYELCKLKPPFRGTNLKEFKENIKNGIYEPIQNVYSNDLKKIISIMLRQNPNERPSAKELLNGEIIQKKIQEYKLGNKFSDSNNREFKGLIETIKIPKNFEEININLPNSKYNNEKRIEEMLFEDEYETNKEKNEFLKKEENEIHKELENLENLKINKINNIINNYKFSNDINNVQNNNQNNQNINRNMNNGKNSLISNSNVKNNTSNSNNNKINQYPNLRNISKSNISKNNQVKNSYKYKINNNLNQKNNDYKFCEDINNKNNNNQNIYNKNMIYNNYYNNELNNYNNLINNNINRNNQQKLNKNNNIKNNNQNNIINKNLNNNNHNYIINYENNYFNNINKEKYFNVNDNNMNKYNNKITPKFKSINTEETNEYKQNNIIITPSNKILNINQKPKTPNKHYINKFNNEIQNINIINNSQNRINNRINNINKIERKSNGKKIKSNNNNNNHHQEIKRGFNPILLNNNNKNINENQKDDYPFNIKAINFEGNQNYYDLLNNGGNSNFNNYYLKGKLVNNNIKNNQIKNERRPKSSNINKRKIINKIEGNNLSKNKVNYNHIEKNNSNQIRNSNIIKRENIKNLNLKYYSEMNAVIQNRNSNQNFNGIRNYENVIYNKQKRNNDNVIIERINYQQKNKLDNSKNSPNINKQKYKDIKRPQSTNKNFERIKY